MNEYSWEHRVTVFPVVFTDSQTGTQTHIPAETLFKWNRFPYKNQPSTACFPQGTFVCKHPGSFSRLAYRSEVRSGRSKYDER